VPYELTVNSSMRDFWFSAFHSNDRVNTSTPFARELGFQDAVLPYSMILFLTGSMTHGDAAKVPRRRAGVGVGVGGARLRRLAAL
jgi:hypothetical protein